METSISKGFFAEANEKLKKYLSIKESIIGDEFIQLAEDSSRVISFLRGANKLLLNRKFNLFLSGFCETENPTQNDIKKLIDYIDNESRAEFISDTFTKILLTNSSKACVVMGSILKSMVEKNTLNHEQLICINALISFFDKDIENFLAIYQFDKQQKHKYFSTNGLKRYCDKNNIDFNSALLTLEKSTNNQLISKSYETDIDADIDVDSESININNSDVDEFYKITNVGLMMVNFIKRVSL